METVVRKLCALLLLCCLFVFTQPVNSTNINILLESLNSFYFNESVTDRLHILPEYDFIVIGSGAGGGVVAGRLSEESNWSVLLLEAGGEELLQTEVPIAAPVNQHGRLNWGYKQERNPNYGRGLINQTTDCSRGRALGGSTVLNYMVFTRGNKLDYDQMAESGNTGWAYKDVLKYFKRSESVRVPEYRNNPLRGTDGPITIEQSSYQSPILDAFLAGGKELGYKINDPNGDEQLGFSKIQASTRDGRRCSVSKGYIRPNAKRPNFHISLRSWVTKININPTTKQVIGVEFVKNNKKITVRARREVILSAGAIASPQLLMLSGVGPKKHLEEMKIPVIQDLKVGYNMVDQFSLPGMTFTLQEPINLNPSDAFTIPNVLQFLRGKGPFTLPGGGLGIAFIKTPSSKLPASYPDIELLVASTSISYNTTGPAHRSSGLTDEWFYNTFKDVLNKPAFQISTVLLRPRSLGRLKLKSNNPFHWPLVNSNYMDDPEDVKTMIEGLELSIKLVETKAFKAINASFNAVPYYGCEQHKFRSDAYWECCIREVTYSWLHHVSTCKMGPDSDPDAVVDPELKVRGIKGLRVIDASILPHVPAAHTYSVVLMIGEKGADMIKEQWKKNNL